jgi:hypothetical protein
MADSEGYAEVRLRVGSYSGGQVVVHFEPTGMIYELLEGDWLEVTMRAPAKASSRSATPRRRSSSDPGQTRKSSCARVMAPDSRSEGRPTGWRQFALVLVAAAVYSVRSNKCPARFRGGCS